MRERILIVDNPMSIGAALAEGIAQRNQPLMQATPDAIGEDVIIDAKTAADIYPIRQRRSMLEQTTMMVAGIDQEKLDQRRLKHQRKLPGKPVRQKASKSKRKQAAKSRARNRR